MARHLHRPAERARLLCLINSATQIEGSSSSEATQFMWLVAVHEYTEVLCEVLCDLGRACRRQKPRRSTCSRGPSNQPAITGEGTARRTHAPPLQR